jgi:hypothetical protein
MWDGEENFLIPIDFSFGVCLQKTIVKPKDCTEKEKKSKIQS